MGAAEKKAVVLLSGGLDSATAAAVARAEGYALYALSFEYGQRHAVELQCAAATAEALGVREHRVLQIDLRGWGGSALTSELEVPKGRSETEMTAEIPVTYVPARNTVFLSYALAWAEVLETGHIFIGVNAVDYSGYPDCRPEFIAAFERMANLATRAAVTGACPVEVHAPLMTWSKAEIIRKGLELGVDYAQTSSCYDPEPDGTPCGVCDTCHLRQKGFAELGLADPLQKEH
jgi:7-cyano-7-deazaguanine synthase